MQKARRTQEHGRTDDQTEDSDPFEWLSLLTGMTANEMRRTRDVDLD